MLDGGNPQGFSSPSLLPSSGIQSEGQHAQLFTQVLRIGSGSHAGVVSTFPNVSVPLLECMHVCRYVNMYVCMHVW